jgi:hypothetical protein
MEVSPVDRDEAILEAMRLIDPEGMLDQDQRKYKVILETVTRWIDTQGVEKGLETARNSAQHMKVWYRWL